VQVSEMITALKEFGQYREQDNPRDMFSPEEFGFSYVHQSCLTAIIFRQMEGYWLLETAACARVGLQPSYELHRRVARWSTTSGIVSPAVVESDSGIAAVLVSGRVSIDALDPGFPGRQYVSILVDATAAVTRALGNDPERLGGAYLEEPGTPLGEISERVHAWWSVQDRDILRRIHGVT
jgi:hypothetical protein